MASSCLALVGYRGTGKTTVAQYLARTLSWDWVDADVEIELAAGKSIAAIFADDGEKAFRDLEVEVVEQLLDRKDTIVALGGGAVLREETRKKLRTVQATVWLKASVETIEGRIFGDETTAGRRPNLTNAGGRNEIVTLLAERTPIYTECATLEVDTDSKAPAEIAEAILKKLGLAT
ncbi:shikimate kinase [Adhaeretor mobilis]|uniref:Shikimate kinase n=1 Tax=Adhaeretor mobilis TaxID=1930276 RepID=A0A517MZ72_9BACT|nr:shikimate kinase [Adhaeretor mobilis]QDT00108.1 Shikimate kinase [Adhaeretor mobilis]